MAVLGGFWSKFVNMLPKERRTAGVITSTASAGRYNVQLDGGGMVLVSGDTSYAVSDRVFVVGKKIESKGAALTPVTIDV